MKKIITAFVLAALICGVCGCSPRVVPEEKYPIVTLELEGGGIVEIVLYPNSAPNTVANFVSLIKSGFYDGLTFHRASGGIVQGGSPSGTNYGGSGYSIKGEFIANKYTDNRLKHTRGMISMARSADYDSAGSQFFICIDAMPSLDGLYAVFGEVISGIEYIDRISALKCDGDQIIDQPVIEKMTVETFGTNYKVSKIK